MARYERGDLSRYIRKVMKEKNLTQRDIELRSGGKITDGYVADILSGDAKNPSVDKIKALARGEGTLTLDGALVAQTGQRTGRSPGDKFLVKYDDRESATRIAWGKVNQPIAPATFGIPICLA